MNFLAHLFLAGDDAESIVGNLAGDFVKGRIEGRFTPGVRAGIAQHRRIDAFTDSHPQVAAFRRVLIPEHGHWSRVISDVFFDHFLAVSFDDYAGEALEAFVARMHAVLDDRFLDLPERLQRVYPFLRDEGWLMSYRTLGGIELTLSRMSHRLRHPHRLESALPLLVSARDELERRFRAFFPDVVEFARKVSS